MGRRDIARVSAWAAKRCHWPERRGKKLLLNAIQAGLALRVLQVCQENMKGKHTTTNRRTDSTGRGRLFGRHPGIRQLELWDVSQPKYADCSATFALM